MSPCGLNSGDENSRGHKLETRSRILMAVGFVIAVNLVPEGAWLQLFVLTILYWGIVRLFGLPLLKILQRSVVALPFLAATLVIPLATPGPVLLEIPVTGWTISESGVQKLASVVWRFFLSVQAASALTLSTSLPELLHGLARLKTPPVLVAITSLMHRYLTVIGDEAQCMMRARSARSAVSEKGRKPRWTWQVRVAGLMIGSLFLRSFDRGERIHLAMLSRGFDGTFHSPSAGHFHWYDRLAISSIAVLVLVIGLNRWW